MVGRDDGGSDAEGSGRNAGGSARRQHHPRTRATVDAAAAGAHTRATAATAARRTRERPQRGSSGRGSSFVGSWAKYGKVGSYRRWLRARARTSLLS